MTDTWIKFLKYKQREEKNMIKTITIFNNNKQFDIEVNKLLATGYSISSTACSSYVHEGNYEECYQAILFLETNGVK